MGKVRVKTLGIERIEAEQKKKTRVKKEQKQARKTAKGAHGGERVISMAPSEEELAKAIEEKPTITGAQRTTREKGAPRQRSRRYREVFTLIDQSKSYLLPEAIQLLKKVGLTKFEGTVELHINTIEKGITGQVSLPHGGGKQVRVAIADDKLLADIEQGKIDFDVLLATPAMMPKLAKVAKILGPKGLMPNPKSGTISDNPEKLAEKYKAGQTHFRTEAQAPIIHLVVGKVSMNEKDLAENIQAILSAIGPEKITNVTLKSTMSPGIKIAV